MLVSPESGEFGGPIESEQGEPTEVDAQTVEGVSVTGVGRGHAQPELATTDGIGLNH